MTSPWRAPGFWRAGRARGLARWIFSTFLWLALVLVIAVFAVLTAQTLAEKPEIVVPTLGLMALAVLLGAMLTEGALAVVAVVLMALGVIVAVEVYRRLQRAGMTVPPEGAVAV